MSSEKHQRPVQFTPKTLSAAEYSDLVFCVPIYQRLFAWGKKQIRKLMNDLYESFPSGNPYYLGILTVAPHDLKLDLVDGQQRMTITTLMAIAFQELSQSCDYWVEYIKKGNRLVFSARDEDTEYIIARSNGKSVSHKNVMMEDAISIIKIWCREKFKNEKAGFDAENFAAFASYIWNNLTLFCSYLPEIYINNPIELNRYFEAMNSTGRQLQQHEILLVDLINGHPKSDVYSQIWTKISDISQRYIPICEDKSDYRNEYLNLINNVASEFERVYSIPDSFESIEKIKPQKLEANNSSSGGASIQMIISFEDLLLMALQFTINGDNSRNYYTPELLLTRFEEANLKRRGKIDEFFINLLKCRLILDYKIIWQETEDNYDYDLVTLDPGKKLEKFQSMMHVSNSDLFYRWLPDYVRWLMDNPKSSVDDEMKELMRIDFKLHPKLPEIKNLCYPFIDRYWFWRLDYELWAHRDEEYSWLKDHPEYSEAANRYVFRVNRSIEHLHPQKPTDEFSERWIGHDLNRFGNLAMISSSFNSSQSNDSAGVKMERVHHQIETSQLQSLKLLHMWIAYRKDTTNSAAENWTREKVEFHENLMISYLRRIRPTKDEDN